MSDPYDEMRRLFDLWVRARRAKESLMLASFEPSSRGHIAANISAYMKLAAAADALERDTQANMQEEALKMLALVTAPADPTGKVH